MKPKKIEWELPSWFREFTKPARFKGIYGGRGSGKSESVARWFLLLSIQEPETSFLCLRETKVSNDTSVKKLIDDIIKKLGLEGYFESLERVIYRIHNGKRCGQFVFLGIKDHTAADSIKSAHGFKYLWVEEAHSISSYGWQILTPTIRSKKSEIWATWNPESEHDPVDHFFRSSLATSNIYDGDYILRMVNYTDNKWFKDTPLYKEMLLCKEKNPDDYNWIWLGGYNKKSKAQVFQSDLHYYTISKIEMQEKLKDKRAKRLIAHGYIGVDWGSNDPMAVLKAYVDEKNREVFIVREFYKIGVEVDSITAAIRSVNPEKDTRFIVCDSSRPDLIDMCKKSGMSMAAAKKGPGSVVEGISKIKRFTIYVDENCENLLDEFERYAYKVDKDGIISNVLIDKHNHAIDALRYLLEKVREQGIV